jgi:predicted DNA-binding transcriptional regulator AlpA
MSHHDPSMLDSRELAALLHCHPETISRRLKTLPDFPRPIAPGRKRLWLRADIDAYLAYLQRPVK